MRAKTNELGSTTKKFRRWTDRQSQKIALKPRADRRGSLTVEENPGDLCEDVAQTELETSLCLINCGEESSKTLSQLSRAISSVSLCKLCDNEGEDMKEHESGHVIDMGSQKSSERLKISLLVSINSIDCELEAVMCKEEVRFERLEHQNTTLSSDEINQRSAPNPLLLESPSGRHSTQKQPSDAREKSSALSNAVHSKTVTRSEAKIGLQSADHFSYSNSLEVSPVEVDHLQIGGGQGDKVRTASYNILF